MRNIISVFGRSPFVPLQMHMEKVYVVKTFWTGSGLI